MQLTPMMEQYYGFKKLYPDKLVLFRMGDFFETFGEDAKLCAKLLNITLTARDKSSDPTPLAGFPHHALEQYLPKIISAGYCAVIVDQIEDPKLAKGIVKRAVTRIVTPGTLDSDNTEKVKNSYIGAFYINKGTVGIAFLDISVGTVKYITGKGNEAFIESIITSFEPVEALVISGESSIVFGDIPVQLMDKTYTNNKYSEDIVKEYYEVKSLEGYGLEKDSPATNAIAMLLGYITDTQKTRASHLDIPRRYVVSSSMALDRSTIANLELVTGARSGSHKDSLFGILDQTKTVMGKRLLYSWVLNPLVNLSMIQERLDIVQKFHSDESTLASTRELLSGISDVERILGKVGMNRVNARDLKALEFSVEQMLNLNKALRGLKIEVIHEDEAKEVLRKVVELITNAIVDSPPLTITEGHIIKEGYSSEIDEIRSIALDSKGWLKEFEERERMKTGITSLKVSYNRVFGYYIEVTNAHKDKVPSEYIRKQTLVNNERYITEELKEKESLILNSHDKLAALEYKAFQSIREELLGYIKVVQEVAKEISKVDVLAGFAYLSMQKSYVMPELFDFGQEEGILSIKNGRHPVVEALSSDEFVSNDTALNLEDSRMVILTGPNMSGKSTYIRQVAVICLMAQIGCFVPALECKLSLVDRIFTRVGASDDLSGGRSTFMVEMSEAANIVNNATKYSLVILDEVGRGTSTYDGVSIAWALAEYLVNQVRARTLFATHYHELLKLSDSNSSGIKNYNVMVDEDIEKGVVVFLRKIVEGGTDRSYGIYVAKMAGLPEEVVKRANEILESFEQGSLFTDGVTLRGGSVITKAKSDPKNVDKLRKEDLQIPLFEIQDGELVRELKDLDLDSLTPLDAMNLLAQWKKRF